MHDHVFKTARGAAAHIRRLHPTVEERAEARRLRLGFPARQEPVPYRTLGLGIERFYRVVPNTKS